MGITWISLNIGVVHVTNPLQALFGSGSSDNVSIIQQIRAPRILAGLLVGATLGIAGALSQGTLRNPLAEPVLLGTTGGSALATLLGILFLHQTIGSFASILIGILGALISTLFTFNIASKGKNGYSLIVMGIAVSALLVALVGITTVMINQPNAQGVTFWSLGTLAMTTRNQILILAPILLLTWIAAILHAPKLDYLALGDLHAKHLGVDVKKVRLFSFLIISISVGALTSIFGQIAFLALAIPHIIRAAIGVRHRVLVIHSALLGASLLVGADLLARTVAQPNELPIGLVTALIGAPILITVIRKSVISNE